MPDPVRWIVPPHARDAEIASGLVDVLRRTPPGAPPADGGPWECLRAREARTILRRDDGERRLFCKLYEPRATWRLSRLAHAFKSPAARAADWLRRLDALGVGTVPLVAAGDLRAGALPTGRTRSFVVTSSTPTQRTLEVALRRGLVADRAAVAERLRAIVRTLHAADVGSFELRTENVLYDAADGRLLLFDMDRLGRMLLPHKRRRVTRRDLATLEGTVARVLGAAALAPPAEAADALPDAPRCAGSPPAPSRAARQG